MTWQRAFPIVFVPTVLGTSLYLGLRSVTAHVGSRQPGGAAPRSTATAPRSILAQAISRGDTDTVRQLLQDGADARAQGMPGGGTLLHIGAVGGQSEMVALLLQHAADPNARNRFGYTPMHIAAWGADPGLITLLYEHGGDPSATDLQGQSPLHAAAKEGRVTCADALLELGADPHLVDTDGRTAAEVASTHGHKAVAEAIQGAQAT